MNKSIRKAMIFIVALFAVLLAVIGLFGLNSQEASAATYTTAKYLTRGSTNNGSNTTTGCPDNFKVYMHGSSVSGTGTMYQDKVIDWSYVYIKVETSQVSDHISFRLLRNGSTYMSKSLSGNAAMTLYSGSLTDGDYELEYTCRYRPNIFVGYTTYVYSYRFEVDKSVPTYSLKAGGSTISSGVYTNKQIVYTASDAHFSYIRYKKPTSSSYTTTGATSYTVAATEANNGWWYFQAYDTLGASCSTVSVYLDTVKPVGKVTTSTGATVSNGGYTNKPIKYTATDTGGVSKYEVKKAGSSSWTSYTSGTSVSGTNGWYYFRATDKAGNVSDEYKIYYDSTTPTGTLYGGTAAKSSGSYTNASYVRYVASDSYSGIVNCYVKMPGSSSYTNYASGTQLSMEGTYSFYCIDKSGNQSATVTITLDKSKPIGMLYGGATIKNDASFTNASYVRYVASDSVSGISACYVKKPGSSSYVSCTSIDQMTAEGTYYFYCIDRSGNVSDTVSITLDRTVPIGTLYGGTTAKSNGGYTNAEYVKYVASDALSGISACFVKAPGQTNYSSYTSGAQLTAEGTYSFYTVDRAGNQSGIVTITLDKTKPAGTLYAGETSKGSGSFTNASYIKYAATDGVSGVLGLYVKKPGKLTYESYASDTQITSEGVYSFYAVDRAGNQSDAVTITLDRTKPAGTLYGGSGSLSSGSYTNAEYVRYVASDSLSGLANCYVKMPGSSAFTAYASGMQLATQGRYEFYCTDRSGNKSTTVSVTLDKMNPTGVLYGGENIVNSGDSTNTAYIKFIAQDETVLANAFVKFPGESEFVSYTLGTELTGEGTYEFYATDKAGNQSQVYTVTLDRQIPVAQLYVDDKPFGNNGYTNGEHIRFECEETCYVMQPGSDAFEPYLPGVEFYKPGKYVFYGESEAGNKTGYFTIIIDRIQKPLTVFNVTDGKTDGDVVLTWTDEDAEQFAPVVKVTVNGKAYTKDSTIYSIDTGVYEVASTDAAGNVWTTKFTSSKQNVLTETLQKEYWEASDTDGEIFAFASYDAAFAFAAKRENALVRTGEWNSEIWDTGIAMDAKDSVNAANGKYFIYKKSGNADELVAYFTEDRLNEVIAEYAKTGIESYYYWEKSPATISDGENLYSYSDVKMILADAVQLGGNIGCLLDGENFVGGTVEVEGRHVLTVLDDWGNTCEYNLIIIRTAPEILYAAGEGNINKATFDRTYYFKDTVTLSISDAFDEMAMFNVYGEDGSLIGSYCLDETYTIAESGVYTVVAVNHFGESQTFSLVISRNAPEIDMTENTGNKTLDITISESPDAQSHIQTIEIYKSMDGGDTWTLLTADDYGTVISLENLTYHFRTSGLYRVVVTDEFRTGIDNIVVEDKYVQPEPDGVLSGVESGGHTNGTVSFEWTDEANVVVKKDGKQIEYRSKQLLTEDGVYEIVFENFDGYKATYTFVIDTAAPEVVLDGAKDGETVNKDVGALFDGEGVTAELFKDGKSLGAYVSGTILTDEGAYRLVVTDLAQNKTEVEFTIDKTVDFSVNVNDKGLSNSVTVTANETVSLVLTKNGEAMEYELGEAITEPAAYTLTIIDALENKAELSFTIVEPLVQKFEYNFDDTPGFEKALVNGEEKRLNYGTLELFEDGTYEVCVVVNGKSYAFTVTVDSTAPALVLDGVENGGTTKNPVVLTELSEDAEMKVFLNDTEIEYTLGEELTEAGDYRIEIEDVAGNSAVYSFEIQGSISGGIIALIVIAAIAVIGGAAAFVILKKRKSKSEAGDTDDTDEAGEE